MARFRVSCARSCVYALFMVITAPASAGSEGVGYVVQLPEIIVATFHDAAWAQMSDSLWYARGVAEQLHREKFGSELGITSGRRKPGAVYSRHQDGLAMDLRTRDMTKEVEAAFAAELRVRLGEDFDVIVEGEFASDPKHRSKPRHIHVEYDPKGRHAETFVE